MSATDGETGEPESGSDRLAAIRETAGSGDSIFEPDYLPTLREDWPGRGTPTPTPSAAEDSP